MQERSMPVPFKRGARFAAGCPAFMIAVMLFLAAGPASAAGSLTVSSAGINFGLYDMFAVAPLDGQGEIAVTYLPGPNPNPPIDYTIIVSASPNSGSINPRVMKLSPPTGDSLVYNLYTDAGRTSIWSDVATGGADTVMKRVRRNEPQPQRTPVYGRIVPLQDVSVGTYSDSLVVTIIW
jgi:spore coat protein U-like protein